MQSHLPVGVALAPSAMSSSCSICSELLLLTAPAELPHCPTAPPPARPLLPQSELMAQVAVNRARLAPAVAALLADLPGQAAARGVREAEEREVRAWAQKQRVLKRQQHKMRREQQHADALAAKSRVVLASPRPVLGRQAGVFQAAGGEEGSPTPHEGGGGFLHLRPEVGAGAARGVAWGWGGVCP